MPSVEILTGDELLTLSGLARVLLVADRRIDGYERSAFEHLGDRVALPGPRGDPYRPSAPAPLGSEGLGAIFDEAATALPDDASVRAAAERLERPAAREIIVALLLDVAASNGIAAEEQALLDWLIDRWEIETGPVPG